MRKILSRVTIVMFCNLFGTISLLYAQGKQSMAGVCVKELSSTMWNTVDGVPYLQVPGANLGVISFEVLDENRLAFLCNATSEIIITSKSNGSAIEKFPVSFAPRDFVYDNGFFYVLYENKVIAYNESGNAFNHFSFPDSYIGIERITRFKNSTYLLLPSCNSLIIETDGNSVEAKEYDGWITSKGHWITTGLNGDNSYSIKITTGNNKIYEKVFVTDKKVAGVYVVGSTENRIVLDVQTFITESPINVKREIITVELNQGEIGSIVTIRNVPNCYYVLSNKDFCVLSDGSIINMVTAPQGIFMFSLTETKAGEGQDYPAEIINTKYHFNDYLIKIDEK